MGARLRLDGPLLTILRLLWLLVAGTVLVLLVPEVQATVTGLHHLCASGSCSVPQLSARQVRTLHDAGIGLDVVAVYIVALALVTVLVCYGVGAALMLRRSSDPMVILTAFVCVLLCTPNDLPLHQVGGLWSVPSTLTVTLAAVANSVYVYIFPSGRFVPRWSAILAIGFVTVQYLPNWLLPDVVWMLFFVGFLSSIIAFQVYRYRRTSTPVQRQQTKIVVFGIAITCLTLVAGVSVYALDSDLNGQAITLLLIPATAALAPLPFVLSLGVAALRYRLWDVDLVINRTLVYLALTASLAAVYLGSVIALQAIFRSLTGRQSDLAVAVSTLVIAALFNPLRSRMQIVIARAFYRHKYDAAKVLAVFGTQCRDETDLDALQGRLLQVVDGAIQPAHIALWLPEPAGQQALTH